MLEAAAPDHVELAVLASRPVDKVLQRRPLERGEVLAGEIANEIGRGEDGLAVDQLHRCTFIPLMHSA